MIANHSISDVRVDFPSLDQIVKVLLLEDYNTRVVVLGVMALGVASGIIGTFLLLRKRALTADALSHATLPGIAVAFMVAVSFGGSGKSMVWLLLGAFVFGCIGVLCILAIRHTTRLKDDAAIGIVLSVLFGLGLCLLKIATELPGGSAAGLQGFIFGKAASMVASDARTMLFVAVGVLLVTGMLRKEFTLLCFDETFSTSQGWPVIKLDMVLMAMVAIVTVIALQSVGLVLAVAMLIIPAASARYWAKSIMSILFLSAIIGCLSGWLGATVSALIPRMPTGPIIVLLCGFWFVVSFVFGTNNGIVVTQIQRAKLNRRVGMQHILRAMWEVSEENASSTFRVDEIIRLRSWKKLAVLQLLARAEKRNYVTRLPNGDWMMTTGGSIEARRVVRNHRLWETYLIHFADIAPSHVDRDADTIEHVLGKDLVERLEHLLDSSYDLQSPHPVGERA
ncbi:MAG: iron chelate uptake ABC transporter family permease subunit [Phycisphaerae bacterium]|nr:iron chelate uptake ABC transporter family permease subunit [Phycisphaerae bacterium]